MIEIAIAEDHDLVREGLVSLFEDETNINVACHVSNGAKLLEYLDQKPVDVVLMDLDMPVMSGQEALKIITEKHPNVAVIILSMHYADDFIKQCIRHGARGFLPKSSSIDTVIEAIYAAIDQGYYFDDKVSKTLIYDLISSEDIKPVFKQDELTDREKEIVRMICLEKINKEIADELNISIRTVEAHRKSIYEKTNAKNVAGVVLYAIKNGICSPYSEKYV